MTRVIDTSVAVKWFVAEDGQQAAEKLIGQPLIAPDLILAEIANVAWKKWRKRELDVEQAKMAQQFVTSFVEVVPSSPFAARALEIAIELDHPVYDCFYLSLCEQQGIKMITADQRLANACANKSFERLIECL